MIGDDEFGEQFLSNDYLAGVASQVLELWFKAHGVDPRTLLDYTFDMKKKWTEPLTVQLEVESDIFGDVAHPDEPNFATESNEFIVECKLIPGGLKLVFYFKPGQVVVENGPESVSAFFPTGRPATYSETEDFLNELWTDYLTDRAKNGQNIQGLTYHILDVKDEWESHNSLGDTAYNWIESLGEDAVVFCASLTTNSECDDFMQYASAYVYNNLVVSSMSNPFLTRGDDGEVDQNVFTLLVGEIED